jgi:hypothetical protein
MNRRTSYVAVSVAAAIVFVIMTLRGGSSIPSSVAAQPPESLKGTLAPMPAPSVDTSADDVGSSKKKVSHAIDVLRLAGLPTDAQPGDLFDVWVTWGPPIAKGPNLQLLVAGVELERIAEPVTVEGPSVAVLTVSRRDAADLLYGTRYGALSVTQPAS